MSLRDDVILRVVHQMVEALLRAAGLRRKRELPAAEQAIGEGLGALGLPLDLVTSLDPTTLHALLPDPSRRVLVAAALRELAQLREESGDPAAGALRATAESLLAGVIAAELPDEVRPLLERSG